jgi:methylase of polypeptide subunit release factors
MNEVRKIKHDLDIQIIGSDISIRAVDTAASNMKFAELHKFESSFTCNSH